MLGMVLTLMLEIGVRTTGIFFKRKVQSKRVIILYYGNTLNAYSLLSQKLWIPVVPNNFPIQKHMHLLEIPRPPKQGCTCR